MAAGGAAAESSCGEADYAMHFRSAGIDVVFSGQARDHQFPHARVRAPGA